jgi:predicted PurR-regulated permease PerM
MLGFDRRAARYIWTAVLVVLLLYLVYLARKTLFIFILAVLFAYLLAPLVNLLDRALPASRTRTPALTLAYIIFVGVLGAVGFSVGSRAVDQAKALAADFPNRIQSWTRSSPGVPAPLKEQIVQKAQAEIGKWSSGLVAELPKVGLKFITVASDLLYIVIIPILAFFFLKDGRLMRGHVLTMVSDENRRAMLDGFMTDIDTLLAHYMRALVLLSLAAFAAYGVTFLILGVPYGLLLAALACLLEFIPMLGPLTAGITIVVVIAVSGGHVLAVIVFLLAYRLFQDYILSPHLMGQGVEVHPLLVLFGVFAGAEIAGIPGTFLSVPILALVRLIYMRIVKTRRAIPVGSASGPDYLSGT